MRARYIGVWMIAQTVSQSLLTSTNFAGGKVSPKISGSSLRTLDLSELKLRAHFRARKIGAFKRNTCLNVYEKLSGDFLCEKKKVTGDFRETHASFLVAVSLAFRATN